MHRIDIELDYENEIYDLKGIDVSNVDNEVKNILTMKTECIITDVTITDKLTVTLNKKPRFKNYNIFTSLSVIKSRKADNITIIEKSKLYGIFIEETEAIPQKIYENIIAENNKHKKSVFWYRMLSIPLMIMFWAIISMFFNIFVGIAAFIVPFIFAKIIFRQIKKSEVSNFSD